jgi:hypothetical protein
MANNLRVNQKLNISFLPAPNAKKNDVLGLFAIREMTRDAICELKN